MKAIFYGHFSPWENEQFACVQESLVRAVAKCKQLVEQRPKLKGGVLDGRVTHPQPSITLLITTLLRDIGKLSTLTSSHLLVGRGP